MSRLLRIKPMSLLSKEAGEQGEHTLKRSLGALNLVTLGIGAIIGAGIFVLTGQAAAKHAGPAVALSFVLAGITCAFAGLCYAEFASIIPIAGSAYTYGYATLGEFVAWIIGWDLGLEYGFGAATVASGWSGYCNSLLQQLHIYLPPRLTATPGTPLVYFHERWLPLASLPPGASEAGLPHVTALFNLVAILAILVITTVLVIGIKESANLNTAIVFIKLSVVGIFIVLGVWFLIHHPATASANWHPFIPPSDGHGNFGWHGIAAGAASIFFAYIGFDAVSTAAQEAKNPQKDMPLGILGSLVICTILYIVVSTILTGLVNYHSLNVADPVALGIDATGVSWGSLLVKIGAVFGLATVMLALPALATKLAGMVTPSRVESRNIVAKGVPFHCALAPEAKFAPVMIRVKPALPVITEAGSRLAIVGLGAGTTVNGSGREHEASKALTTETEPEPATARTAAGMFDCINDELTLIL